MSGDPLMAYWSSRYDVACCLAHGMCECEETCGQRRVQRGEPTYEDLLERIEMLEMQLIQAPALWRHLADDEDADGAA